MAKATEQVKLAGDGADLFRDIQDYMASKHGYRPSNAETARLLCGFYYRNEMDP